MPAGAAPCSSEYALGLRSPSRGRIRLRSTGSLRYALPSEGVALLRHREFIARGVRRTGQRPPKGDPRGKGALFLGTEGGRNLFCRKAFQGFGGRGWERIVFAKAIPWLQGRGDGKCLNPPKPFPVFEGEGMESIRILQNHSQELKRRGGRSKESKKSIP